MGLKFWASTFLQLSPIAKIWEEKKMDNCAMLPVFRGLLQRNAKRRGQTEALSIFDPTGQAKHIFKTYNLVTHLYNETWSRKGLTSIKPKKATQIPTLIPNSFFNCIVTGIGRAIQRTETQWKLQIRHPQTRNQIKKKSTSCSITN